MFAETDWAAVITVVVPVLLTSLTTSVIAVLTLLTHRDVKVIGPKVTAIDNAVNGQPPGTPPMVEKVHDIADEQERVKDELAASE